MVIIQKYLLGEDIVLTLKLKNVSEKTLILTGYDKNIDFLGHRSNFRFDVTKDSNELCKYRHVERKMKMAVKYEKFDFNPGEEKEFTVTLNKWYDIYYPGKYTVQSTYSYNNYSKDLKNIWTVKAKSNKIEFEIEDKKEQTPVEAFSLTIKPSKNKYNLGENVEVNVTLENVSKKQQLLSQYVDYIDYIGHRSDFSFDVIKDGKDACQYLHRELLAKMMVKYKQRKINSGEKIEYKVSLNSWYRMNSSGKYSVQATYMYNMPDIKRPLCFVKSNKIELEILSD